MTCFTWSVVALYTVCIYIYVYIIYICICSHVWHDLSLHSITLVCTTHSYVGFTYGTYFHWHVWHDLFTCVTWLVQMCDMTCRCTASHLSVRLIHICDSHMVHGFIDMCDMTCSHVWHDLFTCVTHLLLHNITQSKREVWDFLNYDAVCQDIMPWRRLSYRRAKHCNMRATHCNMRASWLSAVLLSWYGITPFTCHTHKCVMAHT